MDLRITRMYQVFSEQTPSDVELFRDVEKAIAWLRAPSHTG